MTIVSKARRIEGGTNVPPQEKNEISTTNPELEKLEKTQHSF